VPYGAAGEPGVAGEQFDLADDGTRAVRVEGVERRRRGYA
jgi:hypothetical protein